MRRAPWTLSAFGVLLAGTTSGCASLWPAAGALEVPAAATAPAPGPSAPLALSPYPEAPPQGLPSAPLLAEAPIAPAAADRGAPSASPIASAPSGARAAPRAAPGARPTRGAADARPVPAAARAGQQAAERPAADTAGPTVTTFVYADAPAPVRREATRNAAPAAPAGRVPEGFNPYRIAFAPGAYRCELGRSVQVRTVSADLRTTVLGWGREEYTLRSVDARSGALRYEDPASGLVWIVLKDRSMLLDTRAGQRLANACRSAA